MMNEQVFRTLRIGALVTLLVACGQRSSSPPPRDDSAASGAASAPTSAASPESIGQRPEDPAATVRAYMTALTRRDFGKASAFWEPGADAAVVDSASFARAHGDTTVAEFEVGTPGGIEGAAGSRYVVVPVVMRGSAPDRPPLLLHGQVTLRRSVVDGAMDAMRHWRISHIAWSSNAKPAQRQVQHASLPQDAEQQTRARHRAACPAPGIPQFWIARSVLNIHRQTIGAAMTDALRERYSLGTGILRIAGRRNQARVPTKCMRTFARA